MANEVDATSVLHGEVTLGSGVQVRASCTLTGPVAVGDKVLVRAGARIGPDVTIEPNADIGENAVVLGNPSAPTRIGANCTLEAGAIVVAGCNVGRQALIRAGSALENDLPPFAIAHGVPARIVGYTDAPRIAGARTGLPSGGVANAAGDTVRWIPGVSAQDLRGSLAAYEHDTHIPFDVERVYIVYGVDHGAARGEHAHRTCRELLVSVSGEVEVLVDTGKERAQVVLSDPSVGLYLPAMTWRVLINHTPGAVLAVLASGRYDPAEYVRDHAEWASLLDTS